MKIFITFPKFCHFSRTKFSHLSYSEREKKMTLVHFRKKIAKKRNPDSKRNPAEMQLEYANCGNLITEISVV